MEPRKRQKLDGSGVSDEEEEWIRFQAEIAAKESKQDSVIEAQPVHAAQEQQISDEEWKDEEEGNQRETLQEFELQEELRQRVERMKQLRKEMKTRAPSATANGNGGTGMNLENDPIDRRNKQVTDEDEDDDVEDDEDDVFNFKRA
uniref:ARAD1D44286p n=1 Tax=Blastobotrys adeninivorans TaxID=409370 RepID=A0A060TCN5_BLAAD